jgi:signal transduction histidine kinase
MMHKLSDHQLIEVLRERFELNRKALFDFQAVSSQLEKTNQKLQESEALKTHFLANIRNEINNPLAAILGWAKRMGGKGLDEGKVSAIANMIHDEAFNLDFQLQNIFIAAELEAGEAVPAIAGVNVAGMIETVFDSLQGRAARKGVSMTMTGPASLFFGTDARMLHVILVNLLVNAVEYTPEGGAVVVKAGCGNGRLELVVENPGSGIALECQERVFDRFLQLEMGTTKSHPGHGLGLSITKALTELQGGTIFLSSEEGRGCAVTVSLPESNVDSDVMAEDGNFFLFCDSKVL